MPTAQTVGIAQINQAKPQMAQVTQEIAAWEEEAAAPAQSPQTQEQALVQHVRVLPFAHAHQPLFWPVSRLAFSLAVAFPQPRAAVALRDGRRALEWLPRPLRTLLRGQYMLRWRVGSDAPAAMFPV